MEGVNSLRQGRLQEQTSHLHTQWGHICVRVEEILTTFVLPSYPRNTQFFPCAGCVFQKTPTIQGGEKFSIYRDAFQLRARCFPTNELR